jgi:hypothetical protein
VATLTSVHESRPTGPRRPSRPDLSNRIRQRGPAAAPCPQPRAESADQPTASSNASSAR